MGNLQHNKVLIVDGHQTKIAIGGSTNFSWRGLFVQHNNLVALIGEEPVNIFTKAFENYWAHPNDTDVSSSLETHAFCKCRSRERFCASALLRLHLHLYTGSHHLSCPSVKEYLLRNIITL